LVGAAVSFTNARTRKGPRKAAVKLTAAPTKT